MHMLSYSDTEIQKGCLCRKAGVGQLSALLRQSEKIFVK